MKAQSYDSQVLMNMHVTVSTQQCIDLTTKLHPSKKQNMFGKRFWSHICSRYITGRIPGSTRPRCSTNPWQVLDLLSVKPLAQARNCSPGHKREPEPSTRKGLLHSQELLADVTDPQKKIPARFFIFLYSGEGKRNERRGKKKTALDIRLAK